jgi:uncharacterized membrane protein YbhN (UPF0104 family)
MTAPGKTQFVRLLATLIVLIAGVGYIYFNRTELAVLVRLSVSDLVTLTLCILIFFVCTGYTFNLLVGMLAVKLAPVEWTGLTFLTNALNYLGPIRPGVVAKAVYLKHEKGMSYARFSSVLAANGFILFFYSGAFGLILLLIFWFTRGIVSYVLIGVCIALLVGAALPFAIRLSSFRYQGRIWSIFNDALEGFVIIRGQHTRILAVGASVMAQYLTAALCYMIAFQMLGLKLSFHSALIIGVFSSIANFFTLTPNNLGIQEIVTAYLVTITGLSFSDGLLAATLVRVFHVVITFVLAPVFTYLMLRSTTLSLSAMLPGKRNKTDALVANQADG